MKHYLTSEYKTNIQRKPSNISQEKKRKILKQKEYKTKQQKEP